MRRLVGGLFLLVGTVCAISTEAKAQQPYKLYPFQCPSGQFVYAFNPASAGYPGWFCQTPTGGGGGGGGDTITSPVGTLTVGGSPTATTLDINLANPNTWTNQTFNSATLNGAIVSTGSPWTVTAGSPVTFLGLDSSARLVSGTPAGAGNMNGSGPTSPGDVLCSNNSGSTLNTAVDCTGPIQSSSLVTLTGTQTLTNKTLAAPTISTILNGGTLSLPTSTDTLVGRATTDTLTNKTLGSPVIAGATITTTAPWSVTAGSPTVWLGIDGSSHLVTGTPAGSGNMNGSGSTTVGNLLQSNNTGATLNSATDTGIAASAIVTLTGVQTLTNKTLTSPVIAQISNGGTLTLPTSTDTLVGRATTDTLTSKTLTSPTINSGTLSGTMAGNWTASGNVTFGLGIKETGLGAITCTNALGVDSGGNFGLFSCGGGGSGLTAIADGTHTWSSPTSILLSLPLQTAAGSGANAPIALILPDRTVTTSPTLTATDAGGQVNLNGIGLVATVNSGTFGTGASFVLTNQNVSPFTIGGTATLNGLPWSSYYLGSFVFCTFNSSSAADCSGFPGFAAINGDATSNNVGTLLVSKSNGVKITTSIPYSIGWVAGTNPDKATVVAVVPANMAIDSIKGRVEVAEGSSGRVDVYATSGGTACASGTNLTNTTGLNINATGDQSLAGTTTSVVAGQSLCLHPASGSFNNGIATITVNMHAT